MTKIRNIIFLSSVLYSSFHKQVWWSSSTVLKHGPWHELWKTALLPLTTRVSDVFSGFPIQPMQLLLKYDSELALHRSYCRSSKQDGSVSSGTWHEWRFARHVQSPIYVDTSIRGLPKDWRRRPGRPRRTWLRTMEADLQPLSHGLNSAWRLAQDRGRWNQLVETATLQPGGTPAMMMMMWWYCVFSADNTKL